MDTSGRPANWPDYHNSIVNLMASLGGALGAPATGYPPLATLPPSSLEGGPLLLLIIDGMGDRFLARFPDSFLARHRRATLTSVFPTTTASAITSFYTGVAPQQHAITGWFTWFREIGCVATVLPFHPRYRGEGFERHGIYPDQFIGSPPFVDGLTLPCHMVSPAYIADSVYSRTIHGRARRHSYQTLEEMFALCEATTLSPERSLTIAYWAELDGLAHQYGPESDEVARHFLAIDRQCQATLGRLVEHGVRVVVTADHGLLETNPAKGIAVEDHPQLAECLTLPLCGEPRAAFCYVRAHRVAQFEEYITQQLGHACDLFRSDELIAQGLFGHGTLHRELASRCGDYLLLMRDNYTLSQRLNNETPYQQRGVHGGLSADELLVPLITLTP